MGIRLKFTFFIIVMSLLATAVVGVTGYKLSRQRALSEAQSKGEILFNYIQASSKFFSNYQHEQIKELVDDEARFIPDLMSRFVVTRMEFEIFKDTLTGYTYKDATKDPLVPENKADEQEMSLISFFQENPDSLEQEGQMVKEGEEFFYMTQPIRIKNERCLKCHGDPLDAPADQHDFYDGLWEDDATHGYGWEMDETVGVSIVYVSLAQAFAEARDAGFKILYVGIACLLLTIISIWIFLNYSVVGPIIRLAESATEISIGNQLSESVRTGGKDEIGELSNALDRLRISLEKLLKRG